MTAAADGQEIRRLVESVGLPTALLLLTLAFAAWMFRRHVLPWIDALVQSHVQMVESVRVEMERCAAAHDRIQHQLDELLSRQRDRPAGRRPGQAGGPPRDP